MTTTTYTVQYERDQPRWPQGSQTMSQTTMTVVEQAEHEARVRLHTAQTVRGRVQEWPVLISVHYEAWPLDDDSGRYQITPAGSAVPLRRLYGSAAAALGAMEQREAGHHTRPQDDGAGCWCCEQRRHWRAPAL